jgi:hypothetical protein
MRSASRIAALALVGALIPLVAAGQSAEPAQTRTNKPGAAAAKAPTVGVCKPTKTKFLASSAPESVITSASFKNIPESAVAFIQGGNVASCVIVLFSAEGWSPVGNYLMVRAMLDGTTAALPDEIRFTGDDPNLYRTHTMSFIFPSVAPGTHTVRMQFRSTEAVRAELGQHNTIVQFTP